MNINIKGLIAVLESMDWKRLRREIDSKEIYLYRFYNQATGYPHHEWQVVPEAKDERYYYSKFEISAIAVWTNHWERADIRRAGK